MSESIYLFLIFQLKGLEEITDPSYFFHYYIRGGNKLLYSYNDYISVFTRHIHKVRAICVCLNIRGSEQSFTQAEGFINFL